MMHEKDSQKKPFVVVIFQKVETCAFIYILRFLFNDVLSCWSDT